MTPKKKTPQKVAAGSLSSSSSLNEEPPVAGMPDFKKFLSLEHQEENLSSSDEGSQAAVSPIKGRVRLLSDAAPSNSTKGRRT